MNSEHHNDDASQTEGGATSRQQPPKAATTRRVAHYHYLISNSTHAKAFGCDSLRAVWLSLLLVSNMICIAHEDSKGEISHIHILSHVSLNNKKRVIIFADLKKAFPALDIDCPYFISWIQSSNELDPSK